MSIQDILTDPFYKNFLLTLITSGITIFVKYSTRNDTHRAFRKEDVAIGFELSITAIFLLLMETSNSIILYLKHENTAPNINDKILSMPFVLLGLVLLLWIFSTMVRKIGWKGPEELFVLSGIIVPNLFGIFSLVVAVNFSK